MGEALRHFVYLMTLVETIDVFLIDSVSQSSGKAFGPHSGLPHGLSLRPLHLPQRSFEGLNRALPIKQISKIFGSTIWDYLATQLRARSICKTTADIKSIYAILAGDPDSGLVTCRASRWRFIWTEIYRVKQHLHQKGLVRDPKDDNDLFYHIPALEDGLETTWHVRQLLRRTGFSEYQHPIFQTSFFSCYLARLLQRDAWEQVKEVPPDRLSAKSYMSPLYLHRRTVDVVLHYARQALTEQGICLSPPDSTSVSIPRMSSDSLIQIWHRARAQMLADGVPPELILVGGLGRLEHLWKTHRRRLFDSCYSHPLPQWTYRPSENGACGQSLSWQPASANHAQDRQDQEQDKLLVQGLGDSEAELETSYVWPSDWSRHETLAFTNELLALGAAHTAKEHPSILKIPIQHESPAEVAQHRSSTLRILMHIMRKYHESTFNSVDATYEQFWEVLYIGGLDQKWRVGDLARLKQRFEWVLEFIETGSLPSDAHTADQLLWEALADNALSCQTHPYNFQVQQSDSLLNPDLSSRWVRDFLLAKGALQYVEMGIQKRMSGIGIDGFCDAYGVLVAWLWEKSMYQPGNWLRDEDQTCSGNVQLSSRGGRELQETGHPTRTSNHISNGLSSTPARSGDDRDQGDDCSRGIDVSQSPSPLGLSFQLPRQETPNPPASVASSSHPPSPPPYSPLRDETIQGISKRWEAKEDDYMTYLLELNLTKESRTNKFQARFGLHRTEAAIAGRVRILRKDQPALKKILKWTPDEREYLIELLQTEGNWADVSSKLQQKFAKNRSTSVIRSYAHGHGLDISAISAASQPWTDQEDEYLKALRKSKTPLKELPRLFKEKFGVQRSYKAFQARSVTEEEEKFIRESIPLGLELAELCDRFWKQFGTGRPSRSIGAKVKNLATAGGVPAKRHAPWTAEEERFLKDWPHPTQQGLVSAFHAAFGSSRSVFAVQTKYGTVRARIEKKKTPEVTHGDA
ncbi:hypothetical protein B0T10DRAFT_591160 [Thelonectria olida]|uniref:Myb-like domain-containing protein n=1 Tax=Thelonectria olida TaxID=1576542 RepID=A0A9P8VT82_9HYPO|nr:hypothetical protein B0T10DRAFT_591160 [Thelonectria olida]